jgi:hypothetical protein
MRGVVVEGLWLRPPPHPEPVEGSLSVQIVREVSRAFAERGLPLIHPRHTRNFKVNNRDRSLVTGFNRKITLFL